jgi:hypothetical protein
MSNEALIDARYIGGGPKLAFIVDRQWWWPSSFPRDDGRLLVRV